MAHGEYYKCYILVPVLLLCNTFFGGGGGYMEIDALEPAVVYSIQWEAEWTRVQIRFSRSYGKESGLLA